MNADEVLRALERETPNERLISDPDPAALSPCNEPYKPSAASEFNHNLIPKIFRPTIDQICSKDLDSTQFWDRVRRVRWNIKTSPAGHAIPPQPGDASTARDKLTRSVPVELANVH
jgi:hypothetical protein